MKQKFAIGTGFIRSGDQHFMIISRETHPDLVAFGNKGEHVKPEIVDWLKANTPSYSITGGGTVGQPIMLLFKGERDPTLFKMFWL